MKTLNETLEEIEKRADAATEGPWRCIPGDSYCAFPAVVTGDKSKQFIFEDHEGHDPGECPRKCDGGYAPKDDDATFIAASRTDIPKLLAMLRLAIEQRNEFIHRYDDDSYTEEVKSCDAALLACLRDSGRKEESSVSEVPFFKKCRTPGCNRSAPKLGVKCKRHRATGEG
jgi:hypothetical protein